MGALYEDTPHYVSAPPIEAVTFGWGVNEDGQLVWQCVGASASGSSRS